jgi:hypothetical protein
VAPGHYRLHPREDGAVFAHSAGPQSCKQFLHPARQRLWSSRPDGAYSADSGDAPRYAFVGMRGCDLAAIGILDTVLAGGAHSDSSELASLTERLRHALDDALATVRVVSSVQFPDVELDYDLLALHQDDRYAIDQGQLRSTGGFGFDVADFDRPRRGTPGCALHRVAHPPGRPSVSGRPAGALHARQWPTVSHCPASRRRRRLERPVPQPIPQHRGASGRGRLRPR